MGARIAAHFANAGIPSYLFDIVPPNVPPPDVIAAVTVTPFVALVLPWASRS